MAYPGNKALPAEIQERITTTFEQTIQSISSGSRQEALLGCDFILRLDPEFEPARTLLQRIKNGEEPLRTEDLMGGDSGGAPGPASGEPQEGGEGDLAARLRALFERRSYRELLELAGGHQKEVMATADLARLAQTAQTRLEAEPYVKSFLESARLALDAGNRDEAGKALAKARALDPSHPEIAALGGGAAPEAAEGATPGVDDLFADEGGQLGDSDLELGDDFDFPDETFGDETQSTLLTEPTESEDEARTAPEEEAFDFGEDIGLGTGGDGRIRDLLEEGQAARERGDYQAAIDVWSRIFLIDIDNEEATRRIEEARRLKAEEERKAEEIFHEGVAALEGKDMEQARRAFQAVLEAQPNHPAAREYLQQIEAGEVPAIEAPPPPTGDMGDELPPLPGTLEEPEVLKEEILVPPDPGSVPPPPAAEPAPARRRSSRTGLFAIIAGAVLLLVLGAGWYLFSNWDQIFPNSTPEELTASVPPPPADPIAQARKLHEEGKTPLALSRLQRLPPTSPHYEEAQQLIAAWDTTRRAPTTPEEPALPPQQEAQREGLLREARANSDSEAFLTALEYLAAAKEIAPLNAEAAALENEIQAKLAPLSTQIEQFRQREWELALPVLWRLQVQEPENRVVVRLLVDSYYNLGVRSLQRSNPREALQHFEEALNLAPEDDEVRRQLLLARTYQERGTDMLYRIYVKYLPFREIDHLKTEEQQ